MNEGLRSVARAILLAALAGAAGCVNSPVVPPYGSFFNFTAAPVDIAFDQNGVGPRVGKAKARSILYLFSFGDASVAAAARDGGISVVDHVDCQILNVLFFYASYETIVRGR
jgi:hypothetical protein